MIYQSPTKAMKDFSLEIINQGNEGWVSNLSQFEIDDLGPGEIILSFGRFFA